MKKLLMMPGPIVIAGILFCFIGGYFWDEPAMYWIGGVVGAVFLGIGFFTRKD